MSNLCLAQEYALTPTNPHHGLASAMTEASPVTTLHGWAWQATQWRKV